MQLRDATGSVVSLDSAPARLISLVPSLTEALFSLGLGDRIVGVTRYCEEPAAGVAALPKIGGTKTPNLAEIISLRPDLVVASAEENGKDDVFALREAGARVFVTHYPSVCSALRGIACLADLLMAPAPARGWLTEALKAVTTRDATPAQPVRYFCPIWRRPYMVARRDTYMADLLALAGGTSAFPEAGPQHYNAVELADLPSAAPELILLPDEPYPFERRHTIDFEPYGAVSAVAQGQIHFVDGKALTWYGPRTAAALSAFRALFDQVRQVAGGPRS